MTAQFQLPGAAHRTAVIGGTGTGKTVFGAWLLSKQSFTSRPWIALDYKDEELWDKVGDPPMRELRFGAMPAKKGLFRMRVRPGDEDAMEDWLWRIWERGNVGLFCDEVTLIPQKNAFKAILRQGRSKLIPVIACTQRPVEVDREVFTESQYKAIFALDDVRDHKTVSGFTNGMDVSKPLPAHWCHWVDMRQRAQFALKPCPPPDKVARDLRANVPYSWFLG